MLRRHVFPYRDVARRAVPVLATVVTLRTIWYVSTCLRSVYLLTTKVDILGVISLQNRLCVQ